MGALLAEADAALSAVPTQLQADKAALLADMRAYAAANIYDTDEQSAMDALLETAAQAIDSAATVAAVAKLRQVYMGTENIDGELAGIKTYPAKAADELYNKYIFDRSYAPEDMAKALRAYEGWKLKLFSAPDLDGRGGGVRRRPQGHGRSDQGLHHRRHRAGPWTPPPPPPGRWPGRRCWTAWPCWSRATSTL